MSLIILPAQIKVAIAVSNWFVEQIVITVLFFSSFSHLLGRCDSVKYIQYIEKNIFKTRLSSKQHSKLMGELKEIGWEWPPLDD